jgi:hypothetical protein
MFGKWSDFFVRKTRKDFTHFVMVFADSIRAAPFGIASEQRITKGNKTGRCECGFDPSAVGLEGGVDIAVPSEVGFAKGHTLQKTAQHQGDVGFCEGLFVGALVLGVAQSSLCSFEIREQVGVLESGWLLGIKQGSGESALLGDALGEGLAECFEDLCRGVKGLGGEMEAHDGAPSF